MKRGLIAGVVVFLLLVGAFLLGRSSTVKQATTSQASNADYPLLARRLFIDNHNETIINFTELRASLKDYYQKNNLSGSLYFEYLPTGTSIRVDGDNQGVAASLAKLPIAMLLYKASESGKVDLDKKITLKQEWLNDEFGDLYKQGAGYKLTLRDAAKIMLSQSDNTALAAISYSLEGKVTEEQNPFIFLDADYQQNNDQTISIGARSYSSFLKCLYFSCYLEKSDSQELLNFLTQSNFDSRLRAGIPEDVVVAHKIGNFNDTTQSDCGIAYLERKNYVLCVMINGPDDDTTNTHIANLSRLTYDFVDHKSSESR